MDLEAQRLGTFDPGSANREPSIVSSHYPNAQREEGVAEAISCVWICFEERGRTRAKDVRINPDATKVCIHEIARNCWWWRRVAIFSVVDIEEAEIQFYHTPKENQIFALMMPVNHYQTTREIDKAIERLRAKAMNTDACETSNGGKTHKSQEWCPDMIENEEGVLYCPVLAIRRLENLQDGIRNTAALLRFCWSTRSGSIPIFKMRDAGLVHACNLQTIDHDRAGPLAETSIRAIHLVFGWSWQYTTALVAGGVGMNLCTAVLTALATRDFSYGWSIGSYFAAVVTLGLATFAALSAII